LYHEADITFRIPVKIIQAYEVGAPELGILPGVGAQIKNQKEPHPVFSCKFIEPGQSYGHLRGRSGSFPRY